MDAANEWYFDETTRLLYLVFPDSIDPNSSTLIFEYPHLTQLLRLSGLRDGHHIEPGIGIVSLVESNDEIKLKHINIEGLRFTGTRHALLDTCTYYRTYNDFTNWTDQMNFLEVLFRL